MLYFIFCIIGIRLVYLNYMLMELLEFGGIFECLYYGISIMVCIILVTLLQGLKSKKDYKINFTSYIKNTIKSLINNVFFSLGIIIANYLVSSIMFEYYDILLGMEPLVAFISALIGLVLIFISLIGVPIFIIFKSSYKTDKVFYKEHQESLNKQREKKLQEQREREDKLRKEKEQYLQYEYERNCKRNRIIKTNNDFAKNIAKSVLNEDEYLSNNTNEFKNDSFYMFDNKLSTTCLKPKEIWVDNDGKLKYYMNAFESLNNGCSGNFIRHTDNLIKIGSDLEYRINIMSEELSVASRISNLNNQKLKAFKSYIDARYKQMMLDFKGCKAGIEGEQRVNRELDLHTNIINLKNIRLEVKDNNNQLNSIESDNILLTKNGIFVLEVKNYGEIGNYDIIIEKDGRWNKRNKKDGTISPLNNVIKQNNRHIGFLNKFINESTNRCFDEFVEVDGIIVIANEKITIENHNQNQNIFRDSELYSYIKSKPHIFSKEELDEIAVLIKKNNLQPKKYLVYDYVEEIRMNIGSLESYIREQEKVVASLENQYHKLMEELSTI